MALRGYKPKYAKALFMELPSGKAAREWREEARKPKDSPSRRIRQASKGRQRVNAQYRRMAKKFIEELQRSGAICQVVTNIPELLKGMKYGHPISYKITEVHHKRGRQGRLLIDRRYWMGISKEGHRWVHSNPQAARDRGWLCQVGEWNKQAEDVV